MVTYRNPVIPGFYPDPSICRVGEDYYLVTSSFEYFPGVPVFHSRDLVNWEQVGHCLTRRQQLPLEHCRPSGGIYAPTIRYHDGRFYMVVTNVTGGGHLYVYTDDPAGEWSDPVWVNTGLPGIDPSLFFDDDGTCYFTATSPRGIVQCRLDISTGAALDEPRPAWAGTGGSFPEAPHLYKIRGTYYMMLAEGGTERGHMVTIARGPTPYGPWEACPHNPILSHRSTNRPIQSTGHADLVQAHDGSWWLVFLGTRPHGPYPLYHNLGRETHLAPVQWSREGWPVVGEGGLAALEAEAPAWTVDVVRRCDMATEDTFTGQRLPLYWNWLRNPTMANYRLGERPGTLRLVGSEATLDALDSPTFLGRRQRHHEVRVSVDLDFVPARDGEEAGLTVFMNPRHHYEVGITREQGQRLAITRRTIGSLQVVTARAPLPATGAITLSISAETPEGVGPRSHYVGDPEYLLGLVAAEGPLQVLDRPEMRYVSTEVAGGFTGVYLGMYATGNGVPCVAPADFSRFRYEPRVS